MYVILVYDINEKRVAKALRTCRVYLNWVQNSVFEGEISEAKLKELQIRLRRITKATEDSVMIYRLRSADAFSKEIIGVEKNSADPFI
jgi:CRISPR-associated protein Cas2